MVVDFEGVRSPAEPGHVAEITIMYERYTRSVWTSIVLSSRIRPEHAGQGHGVVCSRFRAGSDITWRAGILPGLIRKQGRHCNERNKIQY